MFRQLLQKATWKTVTQMKSVDEMFFAFPDIFIRHFNLTFPPYIYEIK